MSTKTRPDIAYAVETLPMFSSAPGEQHWQELKHLLRHLITNGDIRLTFGGRDRTLRGFADANYKHVQDGRSTEGYFAYLGSCPVSWQSKKQSTVVLSNTEAEYMALSQVAKEIIWLKKS